MAVCEPPVYLTVFPPAVATRLVMVEVPPIFKVPVAPLVKVPAPVSEDEAVKTPLFV